MHLKTKLLILAMVVVAVFAIPYAISEASDSGTVTININDTLEIAVLQSPMAFALDPGIADENVQFIIFECCLNSFLKALN